MTVFRRYLINFLFKLQRHLLSTDAVKPLSSSVSWSITTIGEDPGTAIGLDEVPEAENKSIGFWLMERGNRGCSWPCDMAKESIWPYTHLGLWSNDDDDKMLKRQSIVQ